MKREESEMKRVVFISILAAVGVSAGCTLPDPVRVGEKCPGITAENIGWSQDDPCYREGGREACDREAEEVIHLGEGYCPEWFVCREIMNEQNVLISTCVHGCPEGQVFCGDACINPKTSISHCGANVEGLCNHDEPEDKNYRGENCLGLILQDMHAYQCHENEGCTKTPCGIDEHLKPNDADGECVKNDNDNCGSEGVKCAADAACVFGECLTKCADGYIRCYVPGEGNPCIDPQSHNMFCGAKGKCMVEDDAQSEDYRGVACDNGMHCALGSCRLLECTHENEQPCGDQCVDVTKDPDNCGGCGNSCANNRPSYVTNDVACEAGKCVYTCEAGYENCGSEGSTECVDLTSDRKNCGECGHACEPNAYCQESSCKPSNCPDEHACFQQGTCVTHDATACGSDCKTCGTALNAYEATCDDVGVCHVVRCQNGFHFVSDTEACAQNTTHACGSVDTSDVVDCTALPNVSDVQCMNGKCIVGECEADYHLHENACEANSDENCSYHGHKCQVPNGTSHCQSGSCVTTGCDAGFHQEGNYCTGDNLNNCGGKDCTTEPGWLSGLCDGTVCKATYCQAGYYLDGSTCKPNDPNNCGEKGKNCAVSNGTATCNTSTGTCSTPICDANYHLSADAKSCQGDTNTECGASRQNCTAMPSPASNGKCSNGTCVPTGCVTGYYLDGTTCKANDPNNCGAKGRVCTVSNGTSTCNTSSGTCQTQSCYQGYYLDGSSCNRNDQNNCGGKGTTCTVSNGNAMCNIDTGVCYVASCNTGYYLDGSSCNRNDQNNCGIKNYKCTVSNGSARCNIDTGRCETTGCNTGYYLDGSACPRNDQNNCGTKGKTCTVSNGTTTCNIDTGTCNMPPVCNTGYYLDGSSCLRNDQNNCGTKGKTCTITNGTRTCNIDTGTCNLPLCNLNYHPSADGTKCDADTNSECGPSRQNCNNMGSQYSGGKCKDGKCVPTGCATYFELVNEQACVERCFLVFRSEKAYCCHYPVDRDRCRQGDCNDCEHYGYLGSSNPWRACWSNKCTDDLGLYCNNDRMAGVWGADPVDVCSILQTTCNTEAVEAACFLSEELM